MFRTVRWALIPCAVVVILAAPQSDKPSDKPLEPKAQPWKEKPAAEWTEEEAKQILSKSPWAQEATLEPAPPKRSNMPRVTMGGGGMGGGRRGGGGYPGGGGGQYPPGGGGQYPPGGQRGGRGPGDGRGSRGDYERPAPMTVRWESALPIEEAEQKAHDAGASTIGKPDPNFYRIAVYGFAQHLTSDQSNDLKKEAMLQVDGQKDIKPTKVQVLQREEGSVVLYWFPRSKKISVEDYAITFDAQFGAMRIVQTFILEKMIYNDKLEM